MIKKNELFSKLSQRDIGKILGLLVLRKFKKGDVIFNQREIGRNLFIVKSGTVEIVIGSKTQKSKILSLIEENEFFGELALLGAKYRTASAICKTDCEVYVISRNNFKKLLKNRRFTMALLYTLANRLKKADEEIEELIFNNMFKRVINYLVKESKRLNSHKILSTQNDIARTLGTNRICITKILSYLRKKGLIETAKNTIILKNPEKLYSIGENECIQL